MEYVESENPGYSLKVRANYDCGLSPTATRSEDFEVGISHYIHSLQDIPVLSPQETLDLSRHIKDGDKVALQTLWLHNLRLVPTVARKFPPIAPLEDRISHGNLGLYKACENFDPELGNRFSSYALPVIRSYVSRLCFQDESSIRIPLRILERIVALRNALPRSGNHHSRQYQCLKKELKILEQLILTTVTIDAVVERGSSSWDHDPYSKHVIDRFDMRLSVDQSLGDLSRRQQDVVCMRYGLRGWSKMKQKDIGKEFGVTKMRVCQIEKQALAKLSKNRSLEELYEES